MAALFSDDEEHASSIELSAIETRGAVPAGPGETWQTVTLRLRSGKRELAERCLFCRQPEDELEKLFLLVGDVFEGRRDKILFEPAEPSFELLLERAGQGGVKVEAWIDAGNADTGFYRWDAVGIRFFTTEANLSRFAGLLQQEFLEHP